MLRDSFFLKANSLKVWYNNYLVKLCPVETGCGGPFAIVAWHFQHTGDNYMLDIFSPSESVCLNPEVIPGGYFVCSR